MKTNSLITLIFPCGLGRCRSARGVFGMTGRWRVMTAGDLPLVERIAEVVHPDYPESGDVPAERLSLFPAGCLIAENGQGDVLGYAVSHPGRLGRPPALDSLLGRTSLRRRLPVSRTTWRCFPKRGDWAWANCWWTCCGLSAPGPASHYWR